MKLQTERQKISQDSNSSRIFTYQDSQGGKCIVLVSNAPMSVNYMLT